MAALFDPDYRRLDEKIDELGENISSIKYSLWTPHIKRSLNEIFELTEEIYQAFKTIHYPKRHERDAAWQRFFELKQEAYTKRSEFFEYCSTEHKRELFEMMNGLEYWPLRENVRQMFFTELSEIRAEVIENVKKLNEAAQHFTSVKSEMMGDDKFEVFNRIKEIRESHDEFWREYKDRSQELQEAKEERKKDYEERQERSKTSKSKLIANIASNKERLEKAETALRRQQDVKEELEEKIESAYNEKFKERHEEWLSECVGRISDIEHSIDQIKDWIEEGENRLSNWRD